MVNKCGRFLTVVFVSLYKQYEYKYVYCIWCRLEIFLLYNDIVSSILEDVLNAYLTKEDAYLREILFIFIYLSHKTRYSSFIIGRHA